MASDEALAADQRGNRPSRFRRPATALEGVLQEVRRAIVDGELRPGERIVQDALAAELGVSRVPVREALHILQGEGRLHHVPNYGYYVPRLTGADLRELVEARGILEDEAVRMALPRLTSQDLKRMDNIQAELDAAFAAQKVDAIGIANRAFHSQLIRPAGRVHFERMINSLWDMGNPYHRLYFADSSHHETIWEDHQAIVEAARDRDEARILGLLREHRRHATEAVVAKLDDDDRRDRDIDRRRPGGT